jgi:hypothetical protein
MPSLTKVPVILVAPAVCNEGTSRTSCQHQYYNSPPSTDKCHQLMADGHDAPASNHAAVLIGDEFIYIVSPII